MRCDAYMVGLEFGMNAAGKESRRLFEKKESVQNSITLGLAFILCLFLSFFLWSNISDPLSVSSNLI